MDGIAITVYDKFEEVGILVDIIRNNWKNKYYITLCSNYPDAKKHISDLDIDEFIQGSDIVFNPSKQKTYNGRLHIRCRVMDQIKKGCQACVDAGCKYVLHLHSDAWPLDEKKYLSLKENMIKKKKKIAIRGLGLSYYGKDVPLGHMDDMFFLFESSYFKNVRFFEYNPLELIPHLLSMHGALVTMLITKVGLKNVYYYSHYEKDEYWDGRKKTMLPLDTVVPMSFDPHNKFLHVHTQAFPGDYGKNIQAMYLRKNNIVNGSKIQEFLDKYHMPRDDIIQGLKKIEKKQNKKLRIMLFNPDKLGRKFNEKEKILVLPLKEKLKISLIEILRAIFGFLLDKKKLIFKLHVNETIWPLSLEKHYRKVLDKKDFPKEYKDFWFERN